MDGFSVGEVAALAHVSVRTLHHYDEIGLLSPSERTAAGYRHYTAEDLQRLQQVLYYRELSFGLDEIGSILAEPGNGAEDHLRRQHRLLREQISRHQAMVAAIEKEMEARQMGISLTPQEQLEIFGENYYGEDYDTEARQRWGDTPAYQQSQQRTAAYTKDDWIQIKAETDANEGGFVEAMRAGAPADSDTAMLLAEAHRQGLVTWFYDCGYDIHRGLAEMYLADERFSKHYDDLEPGLARYVHDAILANAARAEG
ncbi:MAG: MerR family transcriptional regulator [Pseudonocardiales bacterium]|nr:MAG: MerR family transcriptional regulator [Pseudonocardiales bacterium]